MAAGVPTRGSLRFEIVDDLQIAIETVLRSAFGPDDRATIGMAHDAQALTVWIGPVGPNVLRRRLHEHDASAALELGAILGRLVDDVALQDDPLPSIVLQVDVPADGGA